MPLELTKPRRIELILRQIDRLPTLPAIATRLLSLTASDDAEAREVIQLVQADPALTARVLAMVRAADKGVVGADQVITVDRAVMLLGFSAIRNVVLSLKVVEALGIESAEGGSPPGTESNQDASGDRFDRRGHWMHSLAVAIAAERIAAAHKGGKQLDPGEAFVCGLLHGIGKLALDHVLPRSYAKVVEMADARRGDISECERQIIGIDHHTAGKRLAEQWGLPHVIQDCIWLHGAAFDTLPQIEHRRMVGLVGLADLLVRQRHVGYSGNFRIHAAADQIAAALGLEPARVSAAVTDLHEQLEVRGKALGIHDEPTDALVVDSIQRANATLGRLNTQLEQRGRAAAAQALVLETVSAFHANTQPGRGVQDVLDAVAASAHKVFGEGFYALLYPTRAVPAGQEIDQATEDTRDAWLIAQYNPCGQPTQARYVAAPAHVSDLTQLGASLSGGGAGVDLMGVLPWIADYLVHADDLRAVRLMPLTCGWGTAAVLLHDRRTLPSWNLLAPLAQTWGAAIAGASQHDGARRLSEQLAEANAELAAAQDRLLRTESMARLGEMAAGAAHEMNNPLAVISGRSQLLSMALEAGSKEQRAAQTIYREAHRLSDLITSLHMFAEPPRPDPKPTDLGALVKQAIATVRRKLNRQAEGLSIDLAMKQRPPAVWLDADHIEQALVEVLSNAVQAGPKTGIQVTVSVDGGGDAARIEVFDDGPGMDEHTLEHALDPFFSAKSAGRRVGMGLPKAQQFIAAHHGELLLESQPGKGTTAVIHLPIEPAGEAEQPVSSPRLAG